MLCLVLSKEYKCNKKCHFYDIHFKRFHQPKFCGALIDNIADSPFCVLDDNDRETNINLKHDLKTFLRWLCIVEYVYK